MRINEKDQQIEKCEELILMSVQNIFLVRPPYEKGQQIKKREKNDFDECSIFLVRPLFTLGI